MENHASSTPEYVQFTTEQLQLANAIPVGAGAISQVVQSKLAGSLAGIPIVVKILSKVQLLQQHKVESAMNEKAALLKLAPHPFIARLYGTAQSEDELYFVMEALPHGDLLQHIRRTASRRVQAYAAHVAQQAGGAALSTTPVLLAPQDAETESSSMKGDEEAAPPVVPIPASSRALRCLDGNDIRVITAQLVLALARTYAKGIVLRDLKPENIVFDSKYRACLVDFDTADLEGMASLPESNHGIALKPEEEEEEAGPAAPTGVPTPKKRLSVSDIHRMRKKTASFCGTAQYVSPEMVGECRWSFSSDLWALGTTVYEMLYGVHMFSGLGPFEVLQKVVKGVAATDHPVPFPVVDLGDGKGESSFAAVKDFILRLVDIDPSRRLGVHPVSRGFDLDAIKRHALFDGFDWSILETQLTTFRPRRFPRRGAEGAVEGTTCDPADPDPSPSLASLYHVLPYNNPQYADYVYKATADANPFERFMRHIVLEDTEDRPAPAQGSAAPSTTTPASSSRPSSEPPVQCTAGDDEDDIMDIIDDVGMRCEGLQADEDFRQ